MRLWAAVDLEPDSRTPAWMLDAACRGHPPDDWFAEANTAESHAARKRAVAVCEECPVRAECLEFAVETNQAHGTWGGVGERERRRLRRRMLARK